LLLLGNQEPTFLIGIFIAVLVGMTIHEFSHNYVGHLAGDPVPSQLGKLTLDPTAHINWVGFAMFVIIGFGPLGQAPIAAHRMNNPRWGYLAAVAAGPFSNLALAIVAAIVYRILGITVFDIVQGNLIANIVYAMVMFNILLFIFNLLPLFPLDGWYIVSRLLPPDLASEWHRHAQTTSYIFFGLILLSFFPLLPPALDPLNLFIGEPLTAIRRILIGF